MIFTCGEICSVPKSHVLSHNSAVTSYFQQSGMRYQQSLKSACAYAQSDQSLC